MGSAVTRVTRDLVGKADNESALVVPTRRTTPPDKMSVTSAVGHDLLVRSLIAGVPENWGVEPPQTGVWNLRKLGCGTSANWGVVS